MKTNIYFILTGENLFHPQYIRAVLGGLDKKRYRVCGITIAREKTPFFKDLLFQYNLWGPPGFVMVACLSLVRILLNHFVPGKYSLQSLARRRHIRFNSVANVNSDEHLLYLAKVKPDIIISSCGQIFKEKLLSVPTIACINRHTALLPQYGGTMPVLRAMMNKEKKFGVSVHYMLREIDKGDIISQQSIALNPEYSLFRNYILGFRVSVDVTLEALRNIQAGKVVKKYRKNDKEYFPVPTRELLANFHKKFAAIRLNDLKHYSW